MVYCSTWRGYNPQFIAGDGAHLVAGWFFFNQTEPLSTLARAWHNRDTSLTMMVPQPSHLQVWLSESDLGLVMRFVNRPEVCLRGGEWERLGFYTGKTEDDNPVAIFGILCRCIYIYI